MGAQWGPCLSKISTLYKLRIVGRKNKGSLRRWGLPRGPVNLYHTCSDQRIVAQLQPKKKSKRAMTTHEDSPFQCQNGDGPKYSIKKAFAGSTVLITGRCGPMLRSPGSTAPSARQQACQAVRSSLVCPAVSLCVEIPCPIV